MWSCAWHPLQTVLFEQIKITIEGDTLLMGLADLYRRKVTGPRLLSRIFDPRTRLISNAGYGDNPRA